MQICPRPCNDPSGDKGGGGMHFSTRSIHIGNEKDPQTGAVVPPIHLASTFAPDGDFEEAAYDYSRTGNPTRSALERTIASLELGVGALTFSSGMAAIHAALSLLKSGDHLIAGSDLYGGTYRILHRVLSRYGITVSLLDLTDEQGLLDAITKRTRMIWVENPGNPLLSLVDIERLAILAHEHHCLLAVDNTFATPVATQPLQLGADIVMHSATKFLGGHSDLLGGALVVSDPELLSELAYLQNAVGAVLSPFDCFLCQRGIKTLDVRFRAQCRTALSLAKALEAHPAVKRVYYPGLSSHRQKPLAERQLSGLYGAMISFELEAGYLAAKRLVASTRLFQRAVSLGAVESLIEQPASMSHASYDAEDRRKAGIEDGLIRLSVGLEHPEDLWQDLSSAISMSQLANRPAPRLQAP